MASFEIIHEVLKTRGLQIYEEKFSSMEFDDTTVLNCISDPTLMEQLKLVIPNVAHFVNFISKFKEIHRIKEKPQSARDKDVLQATQLQDDRITSNPIPLPPPPPPPTEITSDVTNLSQPIVSLPQMLLAELITGKKLNPIPILDSSTPQDKDEGYEEDEKPNVQVCSETGLPSEFLNQIKQVTSSRASNGEEVARKIEENRLKSKIPSLPEVNPELNTIFKRRQSEISVVDVEAAILNSKNKYCQLTNEINGANELGKCIPAAKLKPRNLNAQTKSERENIMPEATELLRSLADRRKSLENQLSSKIEEKLSIREHTKEEDTSRKIPPPIKARQKKSDPSISKIPELREQSVVENKCKDDLNDLVNLPEIPGPSPTSAQKYDKSSESISDSVKKTEIEPPCPPPLPIFEVSVAAIQFKSDVRSQLMTDIRKGIELKKVNQRETSCLSVRKVETILDQLAKELEKRRPGISGSDSEEDTNSGEEQGGWEE